MLQKWYDGTHVPCAATSWTVHDTQTHPRPVNLERKHKLFCRLSVSHVDMLTPTKPHKINGEPKSFIWRSTFGISKSINQIYGTRARARSSCVCLVRICIECYKMICAMFGHVERPEWMTAMAMSSKALLHRWRQWPFVLINCRSIQCHIEVCYEIQFNSEWLGSHSFALRILFPTRNSHRHRHQQQAHRCHSICCSVRLLSARFSTLSSERAGNLKGIKQWTANKNTQTQTRPDHDHMCVSNGSNATMARKFRSMQNSENKTKI